MPDPNFLPYSLQVLSPLKELFLQDKFEEIPDFRLKANSDFNLISSNMASLAITSTALDSTKDQVATTFDALSEYIQDPTNLVRLQSLEYASKNFAAILENSYNTFHKGVTPIVDTLRTRIETRYSELMRREKAEELLTSNNTEPSEGDYTFLVWENLSAPIKQTEIIDAACSNANISSPALSLTNQGYILSKLNFSSEFTDAKLEQTVYDSVVEKFKATFATEGRGITEEQVKIYVDVITSATSYANFCLLTKSKITATKEPSLEVLSAIKTTNAFSTMNQSAPGLLSELISGDTTSSITKNIEVLTKTLYAIQYWILVCKELRFKGKLILTRSVINQETYDDFVKEGGSITDIHNFIKAFYLDDKPMPIDGVKADIIKTADVAERLIKASSKLKFNATFIKSKCLISAYELVLQEFLKETLADPTFSGNAEFFRQNYLRIINNRANTLAGDIGNIDKALYDIIIMVFHSNDLVSVLYKYLGKDFDDLAENTEDDITEADIVKSQCWATINMLADYLFKQLVLV